MINILFSVIMPTYNHGLYIGKAIESVITQSIPDWELLIINDGSTDNTKEIIDSYIMKDGRIRVIDKENGGTASAINVGLDNAHGNWICWLSSDDWFKTDKLETHKKYIVHYPECKFFFSHFHMFDDYIKEYIDRDLFGPLPDRELQIPTLFYRNYIMGVGVCVNRDLWLKTGLLDVNLKYAQDYDMWLRLLTDSPGIFIPERTFYYRHHPNQGSETFQMACLFDASKACINYINTHSIKELFPLLNLDEKIAASKALEKCMDVASEPSSYMYALGFHPLLLLRILEWVLQSHNGIKGYLIAQLIEIAQSVKLKYDKTLFGDMWNRYVQIISEKFDIYHYQPITPGTIALTNYYRYASSNRVSDKNQLQELKIYLEIYEKMNINQINSEIFYIKEEKKRLDSYICSSSNITCINIRDDSRISSYKFGIKIRRSLSFVNKLLNKHLGKNR